MLWKFSIQNYKSIKDRICIDFQADALKEHPQYLNIPKEYDPNLRILKSAVFYGYNSMGKTNVLDAYFFYHSFILQSPQIGLSESIKTEPFLLNKETENKPSFFESLFIIGKTKYRYGFQVDNTCVVEEWLYYADGLVKENLLYYREGQNFHEVSKLWNKTAGKKVQALSLLIQPNTLFLSLLFNHPDIPRIQELKNWFTSNVILKDEYSKMVSDQVTSIYENEKYRRLILNLIKDANLGFNAVVDNIESLKQQGKITTITDFLFHSETKSMDLYTNHHKYDAQHNLIATERFPFLKKESSGAIKFFIVACYIAYAVYEGQLLLIDELDANIDTSLLIKLVRSFNNSNIGYGQILFTSHNTFALNNLLRRDQVFFVKKNKFGETLLEKMHTPAHPVRINKSIEAEYREGRLGGMAEENGGIQSSLFDLT